jgi:hypothetical protein
MSTFPSICEVDQIRRFSVRMSVIRAFLRASIVRCGTLIKNQCSDDGTMATYPNVVEFNSYYVVSQPRNFSERRPEPCGWARRTKKPVIIHSWLFSKTVYLTLSHHWWNRRTPPSLTECRIFHSSPQACLASFLRSRTLPLSRHLMAKKTGLLLRLSVPSTHDWVLIHSLPSYFTWRKICFSLSAFSTPYVNGSETSVILEKHRRLKISCAGPFSSPRRFTTFTHAACYKWT